MAVQYTLPATDPVIPFCADSQHLIYSHCSCVSSVIGAMPGRSMALWSSTRRQVHCHYGTTTTSTIPLSVMIPTLALLLSVDRAADTASAATA